MEPEIIQDYGKTVDPELYMNTLQGHPYIPQADQAIRNIIKRYRSKNSSWLKILDVGCGPGRLTFDIAIENSHVIGLDISESFIKFAEAAWWNSKKKGTVAFQLGNFATDGVQDNDKDKTFEIIMMQGVMHHVHGKEREKFLSQCWRFLRDNGILIIGDEFIKSYNSDSERRYNVCAFYLHIIAEALAGGFLELAEEEAKNLIDDVFSGGMEAGLGTKKIFEDLIYPYAKSFNKNFYSKGGGYVIFGKNSDDGEVVSLIHYLSSELQKLATTPHDNFNRGDLKISTEVFIKEMIAGQFSLLESHIFGPVNQLGGMGVLVFEKKLSNAVTDQPFLQ